MKNVTPLKTPVSQDPSMHEFFLVSLPGLEDLALKELHEWYPDLKAETAYGGVTVMAPLEQGLSMNQVLKIPTRILVRLSRFRVRDFPKLYKRLCEFDWEQWLVPDCELKVFAATKRSRLKIKSRIEETCLDGWINWQRAAGALPNPSKKAKLFVRIVDDEATFSLDTSGERLHKRGIRQDIGEAPLRETIAAAMLQMVSNSYVAEETPKKVELIDPMMGSGTFFIEAAGRDEQVEARQFGFEIFARSTSYHPTLKVKRPEFVGGIGFEQDKKAFKACQTNLKRLNTPLNWVLINQDFFSKVTPLLEDSTRHRWVIVNPPYGERLSIEGSLLEYYQKLFAATEAFAHPNRACFLLPSNAVKGKFTLPLGWKVIEKRPFLNGGISVIAFVFGR